MTTVSELKETQKEYLVRLFDEKTTCGAITANRIARGEIGDDRTLVSVFETYGRCTENAAILYAAEVINFQLGADNKK